MIHSNISSANGNVSYDLNIMEQFKEPYVLQIVRLLCLSVIILGSLIGNSVVIRAVLRAKGAKTLTYSLICNLALGEIVSSCCLPFMQSYAELRNWPFSQGLCSLINPLQMVAVMVVTTSISSIAIVRCLMLVKLGLYKMTRTTAVSLILSGVIWVLAFSCVLPFFLYMTKVSVGNDQHWCLLLLPGDKLDADYPSSQVRFLLIVQFLINYAVPLAITLVSYTIAASKLKLQNQVCVRRQFQEYDNTETQTEPVVMTEISTCPSASFHSSGNINRDNTVHIPDNDGSRDGELNRYESELLRMFYAIVLIFVLCYLPYQCFFLLEYVGKLSWKNWKYFDITRTYLYLLTWLPSALHPICYGMMSEFYHKAFVRLILCK